MTGEKEKVGSTCRATGALRPGADLRNCRESSSESFKRQRALVSYSYPLSTDQVVLLHLQRTASCTRTNEVAEMGKLTAGRRYAG